jgi:hypothetical protein
MNEVTERRVTLSAAVYSTGILSEMVENGDLYLLNLREPIEAAPDLRVWVWEDESVAPRLLDRSEVEAHSNNRTLSVLQMSTASPLGWAVALDGSLVGARFHADPETPQWKTLSERFAMTIEKSSDWPTTAIALRWWRFPSLMEPFRTAIQKCVDHDPVSTLIAWICSGAGPEMRFSPRDSDLYSSPIRHFLWHYSPSASDCNRLCETFQDEISKTLARFLDFLKSELSGDNQGSGNILAIPAQILLRSHPILLAKIARESISTRQQQAERAVPMVQSRDLFHSEPDPEKIKAIEQEFLNVSNLIRGLLERSADVDAPDNQLLDSLCSYALWDLRSWSDLNPYPLDEGYFRENVIRPAEHVFNHQECDTTRLKIAISRSRACCAYIASYLLKTQGLRPNEQ